MSKQKTSIEKRYEAVMEARKGVPLNQLEKQYGTNHETLSRLILRYEKEGMAGLQDKMTMYYPERTKLSILQDYETNGLSLREICDKYDLSRGTFKRWMKAYESYKQGDKFALNGNGAMHKGDMPYCHKREEEPHTMPETKEKQERRKALSKLSKKELQELLLDREAELDILKNLEALDRERENARRAILRELSKD